jgi:hypothetical protein
MAGTISLAVPAVFAGYGRNLKRFRSHAIQTALTDRVARNVHYGIISQLRHAISGAARRVFLVALEGANPARLGTL